MDKSVINRRRLLTVTALPAFGLTASVAGLGGLTLAAARPARALSFEQPADDVTAQYLKARACLQTPNAYHEQLADEVRAMVREREVEISDEDIRSAVAQTMCPLCGCPLGA